MSVTDNKGDTVSPQHSRNRMKCRGMGRTGCGREIGPDEVVYASGANTYWGTLCSDCCGSPHDWKKPEPCVSCGRLVAVSCRGTHYYALRLCSKRCESKYHYKPIVNQARNCSHCSEEFTPKRSDAKYCSTKCRVYAHRHA